MSNTSLRPYLLVSGVIFGIVAILHVVRLINGWRFDLGPWSIPLWMSWGGTLVPAILCAWALRIVATLKR
jgi:hypothetical protein